MAEAEKWILGDVLHALGVIVLYVMSWFARILLVFIPQRLSVYGMSSALQSLSSLNSNHDQSCESDESELEKMSVPRSGPIGRALLQVLTLVQHLHLCRLYIACIWWREHPVRRLAGESWIEENNFSSYSWPEHGTEFARGSNFLLLPYKVFRSDSRGA